MPRGERVPVIPKEGPIAPGDALRALRWSRGLSIAELAELSGFSRSHLSHIETGSEKPSEGLLRELAQVLGVVSGEISSASPVTVSSWLDHGLQRRRSARRRPHSGVERLTSPPAAGSPVRRFRRGAGFALAASEANGAEPAPGVPASVMKDVLSQLRELERQTQLLADFVASLMAADDEEA